MTDGLTIERGDHGVLTIILDRPTRLNAIDMAMAARLRQLLSDAANDPAVRCIVFTGRGDEAFSAGYDIHEMASFDRDTMIASIATRDPLIWEIANHPKAVISAIKGVAHGAGALIAAASDIRVGSPDTNFRVTATKYGSANATWTLPAIMGVSRAKEFLLVGKAIDGVECERTGVLNHLVPTTEVLPLATRLAHEIAENPADGLVAIKALINGAIGKSLEAQYHAEQVGMIGAPTRRQGGGIFDDFMRGDNGDA